MGKLSRLYVAACVIAMNVLLLLAASNCAALYYNQESDRIEDRSPHIAEILASQPELLKLIYPHLSPDEVEAVLRETWNLEPEYELFTQFKEQPFKGQFVNVNEQGFRRVKDQGPWPPDPAQTTVFMFGGSTTFGYGIADHQTVPSHLQELLRAAASGGEDIRVYNWGRGGYYSSQERALFCKLLLEGHAPDVAVFMDGLNDFGSFWREQTYRDTFHRLMDAHAGDSFVSAELLRSLPLAKLFEGTLQPQAVNDERVTPEFVVDRYLANKKILEAVCAAHGVRPLFVWQPVQHYEYHPPATKMVVDVQELGLRSYTLMKERREAGQTGADFLWLADLQARPEHRGGFIYVDAFHYTSDFARVIAQAIAARLAQ